MQGAFDLIKSCHTENLFKLKNNIAVNLSLTDFKRKVNVQSYLSTLAFMSQFPHRVSRVQLLLRVASPFDASSHRLSRIDIPRMFLLNRSKHKGPKKQRQFPSFEKRKVGKYDQSRSKPSRMETH